MPWVSDGMNLVYKHGPIKDTPIYLRAQLALFQNASRSPQRAAVESTTRCGEREVREIVSFCSRQEKGRSMGSPRQKSRLLTIRNISILYMEKGFMRAWTPEMKQREQHN
jgi:hypothetical protein